MKRSFFLFTVLLITAIMALLSSTLLLISQSARGEQPPGGIASPNIPVSHHDRVYTADQFSNTISVTDPVDNKLLGVIRLGDPLPGNLSPLYHGPLLVHGMGFSPDHHTIVVVSIGSNSVAFIDTATNAIKHITYVGRSPHEAFVTPDSKEIWVTVRGENYISVLNGTTYQEKTRITVPNGPGMQIFSPDGKYGYVCSSVTPQTVVIMVADHKIVGRVPQLSGFCPNIAVTPDGKQIWFTLKDIGKTEVFNARPPFSILKTINTGPITNHVNIAHNAKALLPMSQSAGSTRYRSFAQMTSPKSQPFRSVNCRMRSGRLAMGHLSTLGLRMRTVLLQSIR
jgi:DNA-binding beta-propeller fold protein YncE